MSFGREGLTLSELRERKSTFKEMRDAGFSLDAIWKSPGFSSQDLIKPAGFTLEEVIKSGLFRPEDIIRMGYTLGVNEVISAGFNSIDEYISTLRGKPNWLIETWMRWASTHT
jgi:hypothetical protein